MIDTQTPPVANPVTVDANARPPAAETRVPDGQSLVPGRWSAEQAKRIVLGDFNRAAGDRATNQEAKWQEAGSTYLASNRGERFWEGTKTPRANMEIHHAYQQVNALRPRLVDAVCGTDLQFDVEPAKSGTTIGQLHMVRALMQYQLKSLGGRVKFQSFRSCVDRMFSDGLIFGDGIWEWGWDGPRTEQVVNWKRVTEPEMVHVEHPALPGLAIPVPTGRDVSYARKDFVPQTVSRFFLDPCDLMDFYIDPNCRGVNPQQGEYCIRRKMMSIAELGTYRGQPGWDIPDDKTLYRYSQSKTFTEGDTTRQWIQSANNVNYEPGMDQSVDPRLARVEVLRYWQRDHHVWLLGREHIAWNSVNQYEALPFFHWSYSDAPGAFYGISIPQLVRTDQKLIKALIDGRLDELNLILHPPFITKLGMMRSQSKMKLRPGANWEAEDPMKDVQRLEMGNVTQQAFVEADAAENRSQKKTGITDLAILGTPASGGNSANRTATGVQAQTSASNSREHGLVASCEDQCLEPMLDTLWTLIKMFLNPDEILRIVGPDGQQLELDPVDILNADPSFNMKTANNMKMRQAMQSGGLANLTQYLMNPELQSVMAEQQGKVLDIEQFTEFYLDVFNVKAFSLFRQMTPQEQQAMAQRQNGPTQAKMELQQARISQTSQDAHERDEVALLVALIQAMAQTGMFNQLTNVPRDVELKVKQIEA